MVKRTPYNNETFTETAQRIAAFLNKYARDREKVLIDSDFPFKNIRGMTNVDINPDSIHSLGSAVTFNGSAVITHENASITTSCRYTIVGKASFINDILAYIDLYNIKFTR